MALNIREREVAGLTLIELLVVISILTSVFGLGLASFRGFNRRERLKQAGLTLKSNLRFAQTKAISAQKPSTDCTTFVGIEVSFSVSSYTITPQCSPEGLGEVEDTVTLPSDVTFSTVPASFTFLTRTTTVNVSGDQSLSLTNGSQSYIIVVSPSGSVSVQGFQ